MLSWNFDALCSLANGVSTGVMRAHGKSSIRVRKAFLGNQCLSWELKDKRELATSCAK